MKVYGHQKTPGQQLLTNFDDIVRATTELEKEGQSMRAIAKRKHDDDVSPDVAARATYKARRPFRKYASD